MSSILFTLPDDNWFEPGCIEPDDKTLCVIIHAYGDRTPYICQFRKADFLNKEDYFLDVSEKWSLDSYGCGDEWSPGFLSWDIIDYWKPLGLPPEENKRILEEIEGWFEE